MVEQKFCPMGFFCFDHTTIILIVVGLFIIGAIILQQYLSALKTLQIANRVQQVQIIERGPPPLPLAMKRILDPLAPPEKTYYDSMSGLPRPGIPLGAVPINIPTRGEAGGYQKVGVIAQNGEHLPLYGQQTYPGSRTWNYFVNTSGFHSQKLPIQYRNKDCSDDTGCDEITSGTTGDITIPGSGGGGDATYDVVIYKNSTPRYIPYL